MIRVLCTAAFGPSGASTALLLGGDPDVAVLRGDADPLMATRENGVVMPRADEPGYADWVLRFARDEHVNYVLPGCEEELLALADHVASAMLLAPDKWMIRRCLDKGSLYPWAAQRTIPVPHYIVPALLKPRIGRGGRGVMPVPNDFLVVEELAGPEYSVDVVYWHGTVIDASVRERMDIVGGTATKGRVCSHSQILHIVYRLGAHFDLHGPACVQFMTDPKGGPVLIDVNLRFGGGVTITANAGLNLPRLLMDCVLGRVPGPRSLREGTYDVSSLDVQRPVKRDPVEVFMESVRGHKA